MNCDQVFDILTRGPFPTGDRSDRAVELHLADCPDCQRLANALRPAIELFQEAIHGDESRELPGYWGGTIDETEAFQPDGRLAQVTRRLPASLHRRIDRSRRWVSAQTGGNGLRFVAAMLIGVALGAVVWTAGVPAKDAWHEAGKLAATSGSSESANYAPEQRLTEMSGWAQGKLTGGPRELHVTLHLAAACLTVRPASAAAPSTDAGHVADLTMADLAKQQCCTRCHNALAENSHPQATATVSQSCEICHR